MKMIWERIDNWLAANAPQVLKSLRPGATDEEIDRAEALGASRFCKKPKY